MSRLFGIGFIVAAIAIVAIPDFIGSKAFNYEKQIELKPDDVDFPKLESHYPLNKLSRYAIIREENPAFILNVVDYQTVFGQTRRAIPYLSTLNSGFRHDAWKRSAESILQHADSHMLFLTWWDNAQRLDMLTGIDAWTLLPDAQAWTEASERSFWLDVAGGSDDEKSHRLARWFCLDANQAIREISEQVPKDIDVYILVTLDDLARLKEIENLSGIRLPLETQSFQMTENFHSLIAQVKRWAEVEGMEPNYLLQQIPDIGVRAWRITDSKSKDMLIARLLPFTGSINRLPDGLQLIYQSEQAYLSIYKLNRTIK